MTKINYEDSLFYQISSSAKCFDMLFDQFFKELNSGISAIEHLALIVVSQIENCCQRDLARVILKDRANTGKLVKKLEQKGLIAIETKSKNNKPVKILSLTKIGEKLTEEVSTKVKPLAKNIRIEFGEDKLSAMVENLKLFRETVKKAVKMNI